MSTFFSTGLNRKIDALMDRLFGAGVASHATIIEQINYLMFLRALTKHDDEAKLLNPNHEEIFKGDLADYRWDNLLMLNAEVLFNTLEQAYRKLPELTTDKTIALLFRNAHIKIYDKPTLRVLLHEIEKLVTELDDVARHGEKDIFGDMYEYLLSKLAQAGTNGQFRTPRHIIKFIVDVVDPSKGETILDPACGTAGFLVEALDHLRHKYTSERFVKDGAYPMDKLTGDERNFIFNHAFTGFDSDEDMVKFGVMNLYLHNLSNAQIKRQNTLVDTAGDRTKWGVILANPPFAGKIESESVSEDLRMGTRATEVLFVRYMIDHLSSQGKAGIIVPEGIIFQSTNAHKQLRQKLLDAGLWCVVSLPSGVFQPYSGVKTSILFIDKELAITHNFDRVVFVNINSDGFELNAQRRPTGDSDLNNATVLLKECKKEIVSDRVRSSSQYFFPFENVTIDIAPLHYNFEVVKRQSIVEEPSLTLNMSHYSTQEIASNGIVQMVELGDICIVKGGKRIPKGETFSDIKTQYPYLRVSDFKNGTIDVSDLKYITKDVFDQISSYTISSDDIYISIAGTVGVAGTVPDSLNGKSLTENAAKLIIKDKSKVNKYFLSVMLSSQEVKKQIARFTNAVGVPKLALERLARIKIPLPDLNVQNEIVNEVLGYQKIIDSAETITNTYKPIIGISSSSNFVNLGDVVTKVNDVINPLKEKGDVEYIGLENIVSNEGIITGDTKSSYNKIKSLKNRFKENDILYGKLRPNLNKVWLADRDGIASTDILILRPNPGYNPIYYANYMLSDSFNQEVLRGIKGAQLPRVSFNYMSSIIVPKPDIDEQNSVAKELEKELSIIENNRILANIYQQKIQSRIKELWT